MQPRKSLGLVAVVLAALSASAGCHKSSETEAREAAEAVKVAAQKSEHALREVERSGAGETSRAFDESRNAEEHALAEQQDVAEAVARERRQYTALLTKEIEWADKRVISMAHDALAAEGTVRDEKQRDVDTVRAWRDRLQADLDAARSPTTDQDWIQLKARIQADLDETRPVQVPRTWEKPYGI